VIVALQPERAVFSIHHPVAILGGGVMGTMVAWACVKVGLQTRLFEIDPVRAARSKAQIKEWLGHEPERLTLVESLEEGVNGAQLVFENVPEKVELKSGLLREVDALADPSAIIGSNTSSLRCTPLAEASGRADRFFNMNFCNPRTSSLVELMGCELTAPETITFAKAWAAELGMVVLHVRKDQMGYSHNRLWRAVKQEVLRQIDEGIASPEDIDRGWMLAFGTDIGPCGIMDAVGIPTILSVEESYYRDSGKEADRPAAILKSMVSEGRLGVQSGQGFYRYPQPAFRDPRFLAPAGHERTPGR
jgi:3-hydroxybutyryl-CoA dehydrogenase